MPLGTAESSDRGETVLTADSCVADSQEEARSRKEPRHGLGG